MYKFSNSAFHVAIKMLVPDHLSVSLHGKHGLIYKSRKPGGGVPESRVNLPSAKPWTLSINPNLAYSMFAGFKNESRSKFIQPIFGWLINISYN